jgi:hypothetical protein
MARDPARHPVAPVRTSQTEVARRDRNNLGSSFYFALCLDDGEEAQFLALVQSGESVARIAVDTAISQRGAFVSSNLRP